MGSGFRGIFEMSSKTETAIIEHRLKSIRINCTQISAI